MKVTIKKSYKVLEAEPDMWLQSPTTSIGKKFIVGLKVNETKYREITNEEKEAIEAELRELAGDEYPGD